MSITERMKKYEELGSFVPNTPTSFMWKDRRLKAFPELLADLQTAMRALEVARDSLKYYEREYNGEPCDNLMAKAALEAINEVLGGGGRNDMDTKKIKEAFDEVNLLHVRLGWIIKHPETKNLNALQLAAIIKDEIIYPMSSKMGNLRHVCGLGAEDNDGWSYASKEEK
jgi:hypothetical protein